MSARAARWPGLRPALLPAAGLIALGWLAFGLQSVFLRERAEARSELAARRDTLEAYAQRALADGLRGALAARRDAIERAADDPLEDDAGLFLWRAGEQRLPRRAAPGAGSERPASALYRMLLEPAGEVPGAEPDSPFAERVALLRGFMRAVRAGDRAAIAARFRSILAHRARYVVAGALDLPFMVALLEFFAEHSQPDPRLLEQLLRSGLRLEDRVAPGLQRALLEQRSRFSEPDFTLLCARVAALSQRSGTRSDDFAERAARRGAPPLFAGAPPAGATLAEGGRWYVEAAADGSRYGVRVELATHAAALERELRARGLLAPGESLALAAAGAQPQPLAALAIELRSPPLEQRLARVQTAFALKSALLVACLALALGIAMLALLLHRRRLRLVELKAEFVATVSHELRTPLASIRVQAETLARRLRGSELAAGYPERIVADIDGLSFLVENILSFNRLSQPGEAGGRDRFVPRRSEVALVPLLAELSDELESLIPRKLELESEGSAELVLRADPELIRLLLSNLGRNACSYCEREPVRVRLSAQVGAAGVTLWFQDNGIGIERALWERVFDQFYRAPAAASVRGTGLGLSICRRIMQAHGGSIRIADSSPAGTRFELRFPRECLPVSGEATRPALLIVEDDANLRLALADNLEAEGYAVTVAASRAQAERALAQQRFAVLILDVMLPDGDGYALCEQLRARGGAAAVLMLTARTLEDDLLRGFAAGADDYVAKPYRLRELLARVRALALRGAGGPRGETLRFGGFTLDPRSRELHGPDGGAIELTRTEFDLLGCLVRNRGCAMTRERLLAEVWGGDVVVDLRTVDNFISSLKRKLGCSEQASLRIRTIRGVGYRMEVDERA